MITIEQFKKDMYRCTLSEQQIILAKARGVKSLYGHELQVGEKMYMAACNYVLGELTFVGILEREIEQFLSRWEHVRPYGEFPGGMYHLFQEKVRDEVQG